MTIQGAMNELINLLNADDIPIYYKGGIKKVIETIDDYIDGKDGYVKRKTEPQTCANGCKWLDQDGECTEPSGECRLVYRTIEDEPQTERSE